MDKLPQMHNFTDEETIQKWFKKAFGEGEIDSDKKEKMVENLLRIKEEEIRIRTGKRNLFKGMIHKNVDDSIIKNLSNHQPILSVQTDLSNRIIGMKNALAKINPDRVVDLKIFEDENWMDKINNFREEHFLYYIYFLNKRINDLQWILSNRFRGPQIKFSHLHNNQIFKLIKLREKLDPKAEILNNIYHK